MYWHSFCLIMSIVTKNYALFKQKRHKHTATPRFTSSLYTYAISILNFSDS